MRPSLLLAVLVLLLPASTRAVPIDDPELTKALQICRSNGIEACILNLYANRPRLAEELKEKVTTVAKDFGNVIDTEVLATHPVGKRIIRYYVAVYFVRRPLWLRIDRYAGRDEPFFLPLQFSADPDEILPGYLTGFAP